MIKADAGQGHLLSIVISMINQFKKPQNAW